MDLDPVCTCVRWLLWSAGTSPRKRRPFKVSCGGPYRPLMSARHSGP